MRDRLDEFTRKELQNTTQSEDPGVVNRSKKVPYMKYLGITRDYTLQFEVGSATTPGKSYRVQFQLAEYKDIADEEDLSVRDKVRLALAGDIRLNCSCPAFRWWGYEYITSQLDVNKGDPQNIYPHVRNPRLEGVMCKHCYMAIKHFPMYNMKVVSDIMNDRYME